MRMENFVSVIAAFPDGALAAGLKNRAGEEIGPGTVAVWKHRKSIPQEYWPDVVALARAEKVRGITLAKLVEIGVATRRRRAA